MLSVLPMHCNGLGDSVPLDEVCFVYFFSDDNLTILYLKNIQPNSHLASLSKLCEDADQ